MKTELVIANLKKEAKALEEKIEKLTEVLLSDEKSSEISQINLFYMTQQLSSMKLYLFFLKSRMFNLEEETNKKAEELKFKELNPKESKDETPNNKTVKVIKGDKELFDALLNLFIDEFNGKDRN
jgi:hypothetical protein